MADAGGWRASRGGRGRGVLIGKAYDRRKATHGGDHNPEGINQYTIDRSSGQVDYLTETKTVDVVAEDYGVSPKKVQRATD